MNKYVCLLTACLVASSVQADERFLPYIDWITEHSELQYNGEPLPTIKLMPYDWVEVMVYSPETVAQAERTGTILPTIRGAYLHEENVLLFPDDTDPFAAEDVLVHELVHYLQYLGDVPDCHQILERPAYKLHWEWVEEHGRQDDFPEPSWLFVYLIEMVCYENPWRDHDYAR